MSNIFLGTELAIQRFRDFDNLNIRELRQVTETHQTLAGKILR